MKNGGRQAKRAPPRRESTREDRPATRTLSFYRRMLAGGEKATLLSKEVNSCLERPDLKVVKVADGAKDNWTFLSGA